MTELATQEAIEQAALDLENVDESENETIDDASSSDVGPATDDSGETDTAPTIEARIEAAKAKNKARKASAVGNGSVQGAPVDPPRVASSQEQVPSKIEALMKAGKYMRAFKELGLEKEKVWESLLSDNSDETKDDVVESLKQELEALKQEQLTYKQEQAKGQFVASILESCTADKYPKLAQQSRRDIADTVYALADEHYRATYNPLTGRGEILSPDDYLRHIESQLVPKAKPAKAAKELTAKPPKAKAKAVPIDATREQRIAMAIAALED